MDSRKSLVPGKDEESKKAFTFEVLVNAARTSTDNEWCAEHSCGKSEPSPYASVLRSVGERAFFVQHWWVCSAPLSFCVQVKGYPYWPALLLPDNRGSKIHVYFFGTHRSVPRFLHAEIGWCCVVESKWLMFRRSRSLLLLFRIAFCVHATDSSCNSGGRT